MPSSVDLGKRLESTVAKLVKNGRYNSRSEVLREGVRLVEEREKRLVELNAALDKGLDDIEVGRFASADEVFDRLERRYLDMAAPAGKRVGSTRR